MKAWRAQEENTGQELTELVKERAEEHISFNDITEQPRKVLSTPVYSGTETGERKYSPFTTNIEHLIPFRTLTGRQHFILIMTSCKNLEKNCRHLNHRYKN